MKISSKAVWIAVSVVLVVFLAVTLAGGIYMCRYALAPKPYDEAADRAWMEEQTPGVAAWWDDLKERGILRDTFQVFPDGRRLHAWYATASKPSSHTAILIHGYGGSPFSMGQFARMYREDLGYNVFIPALSAHERSEGRGIQMGWRDREDILGWIPVARSLFPEGDMILHGCSMGAATVMMVSGETTPDYVKAFIEDAGYTSVWDIFEGQLAEQFHLPAFPVLYGADLVCELKYGWGFRQASSLKQVARSTKPVLFIHGGDDKFVPTWMQEPCYEAKTVGLKEKWTSPGSDHVRSYSDHPAEYLNVVTDFLGKAFEEE